VKHFDGSYYRVHYPEDGDEEELSEGEFDDLTITFRPVVLPMVEVEKDKDGDNGEPLLSEPLRSGKSSKSQKRDRIPLSEPLRSGKSSKSQKRDRKSMARALHSNPDSISKETSKRDEPVTSKQKKRASNASLAESDTTVPIGVDSSYKADAEECPLPETENIAACTEQVQRSTDDFAQSVPATDHAGHRIAIGTRFLKVRSGIFGSMNAFRAFVRVRNSL